MAGLTNIRGVQVGAQGSLLTNSEEWLQVTLCTSTTGVSIATNRDQAADGTGFPLPVDTPVTIILAPSSTLWAGGDPGSNVGVAEQPLPWDRLLLTAIGTAMGVLPQILEDID